MNEEEEIDPADEKYHKRAVCYHMTTEELIEMQKAVKDYRDKKINTLNELTYKLEPVYEPDRTNQKEKIHKVENEIKFDAGIISALEFCIEKLDPGDIVEIHFGIARSKKEWYQKFKKQ